MFSRRHPKPVFKKIADAVWPRMGWKRTFRYANYRLGRLTASTHSLAGGFATGAAISFLPLPGTHILQAVFISYIFRFNKSAAFLGTAAGNPWTFAFIWYLAYKAGEMFVNFFDDRKLHAMPPMSDMSAFWDVLLEHPLMLLLPWTVGGYICAAITWPFFYWMFYGMISNARAARLKLKLSRARKTALDITEPNEPVEAEDPQP